VGFAALPPAWIEERLVAEGRTPAQARLAAVLSGGSLGRAQALDPDALEARERSIRAAAALDPEDASTWLEFAREHGEDREGARSTCELLELWLRDVLAVQAAGDGAPLALHDREEETRHLAGQLSPAAVLERIEGARAAAAALRQNAAPALALERMLIGWFHGERL
jgi:DNA polymerase-3 subunit delta'